MKPDINCARPVWIIQDVMAKLKFIGIQSKNLWSYSIA